MTAAAFTGYHPEIGVGHIDSGLTISPVQLLLDREFSSGLKFLERPRITKESIGLDSIIGAGFGLGENYTTLDHTLEHMRGASWIPEMLSRGGWSPENGRDAVEKAKRKVRELVESYKKPPVCGDKLDRARAVLERAKKDLAGKQE
jgi:trimethylamine:corrinoid methyltransferase-like protein